MIPMLIKKQKYKNKDVTDINKDRLKDIIQLGRNLIMQKYLVIIKLEKI